jgi:hypothetical protein
LSIAGHVIIVLLLMFGLLERIELIPVTAIPVEIVMVNPAEAARQNAPASTPAAPAVSARSEQNHLEQKHPSRIPAVAVVDKRAKAQLAALNVNGMDRLTQPGYDGRDQDQGGIPLPPFAVSGPLVRHSRLLPDFCPSTRAFAVRFLRTSPRGDSPCVVANPSPPSGWVEDFQAAEHAQHTTKSLRDSPLRG